MTDNNPLTYVFTTAKLDATEQRWLAELSNYNCSLSYRSGKRNLDADGLSRRKEDTETTIFPDVLKALCNAFICNEITVNDVSFSDLLTNPTEDIVPDVGVDQEVSDEVLQGTALTTQDWHKAQFSDGNIRVIIDSLIEGHRPSTEDNKQ